MLAAGYTAKQALKRIQAAIQASKAKEEEEVKVVEEEDEVEVLEEEEEEG